MGNWRRVQIVGTCDSTEVAALHKATTFDRNKLDSFHCLLGGVGLAGLPNWAAKDIDAVGNLAERGYSFEDVRDTLQDLAKVAPSLNVTVHCGGDYEDDTCLVSVVLLHGKARIEPARIDKIPEVEITPERVIESMRMWM